MNPIFFAMLRFWWMPFFESAPTPPLKRDEPAE